MINRRLSVAPMMDWTDRHCRAFHRLLTRRALLYTEMVTTGAVLHGDRARLLGFDPADVSASETNPNLDKNFTYAGDLYRNNFQKMDDGTLVPFDGGAAVAIAAIVPVIWFFVMVAAEERDGS